MNDTKGSGSGKFCPIRLSMREGKGRNDSCSGELECGKIAGIGILED